MPPQKKKKEKDFMDRELARASLEAEVNSDKLPDLLTDDSSSDDELMMMAAGPLLHHRWVGGLSLVAQLGPFGPMQNDFLRF